MKYRILAVIPAIIVLSMIACSTSENQSNQDNNSSTTETVGDETVEEHIVDIPIYPDAEIFNKEIELPQEYKTNYEKASTMSYKVDANMDDVITFYMVEMPKFGWENIMHMPQGETSFISVWQQDDGEYGSTVSISKWEDELILIGITRAEGLK